jgi:flagellar hook assembly protein FlgD
VILVAKTILLTLFVTVWTALSAADSAAIKDVAISAAAFNPRLGERMRLSYTLGATDAVTIRIYDPDGGLIRTLATNSVRQAGKHSEAWDGRDGGGKLVPDEAYTWTIETASGGLYDPTTFSGGVVADIKEARFDNTSGTITYKMPAPGRVLVRLGVKSGPLLKTLVDWKPRVAGSVTEHWDGRDESKLTSVRDHPNFTTLITYVTLPDATVIAYGNEAETYRDYKLGRGKGVGQRPQRVRQPDADLRLRPENLVPPAWARAPRVLMTFPSIPGDGVPTVKDLIDVRVDVDQSDKPLLLRDQFEIIFFVNNVFFAEAERGHLPFNWRWELKQLPPGEHTLTVNIASFKGQVGVLSRKVRVVKSKE